MVNHDIVVAGERFRLEDEIDIRELRSQILQAVRDGGGYIHLSARNRPTADVLVSPGIPLRIEEETESVNVSSLTDWEPIDDLDI